MSVKEPLLNREFIGIVLPTPDTTNRGRYRVYIPQLQPHTAENSGIWCKNHVHKYRITPSQDGICGSYYPLHAGMSVVVKFFTNQIESAYIDRVISDAYPNTIPYEIVERDDYYQIIRTPKYNNLIAIYEGSQSSKNVPKNSIHIYFNDIRTTIVIDENGINIKTADNINTTVDKNVKITIKGSADLKVSSTLNIQADVVNIKGDSAINMQAPIISQNGTAPEAAEADLPILINPREDYEYFKRSSGK